MASSSRDGGDSEANKSEGRFIRKRDFLIETPLDAIIRAAAHKTTTEHVHEVFKPNEKTGKTPMLRRGSANRILLYDGAFNPPHLGHWNMIHHVFKACRNMFQLVAVIVIPTGDDRLDKKYTHGELCFFSDERAQQLRGDGPSEIFWIFPDLDSKFERFQGVMAGMCERQGFQVEFSDLIGRDYAKDFANGSDLERMVFTSDVGRSYGLEKGSDCPDEVIDLEHWRRLDNRTDPHSEPSETDSLWLGQNDTGSRMVIFVPGEYKRGMTTGTIDSSRLREELDRMFHEEPLRKHLWQLRIMQMPVPHPEILYEHAVKQYRPQDCEVILLKWEPGFIIPFSYDKNGIIPDPYG